MIPSQHRWTYCDLCKRMAVICGTCGNNTCNGGYGQVDGKECLDCPSAYGLDEMEEKEKVVDSKSV